MSDSLKEGQTAVTATRHVQQDPTTAHLEAPSSRRLMMLTRTDFVEIRDTFAQDKKGLTVTNLSRNPLCDVCCHRNTSSNLSNQ